MKVRPFRIAVADRELQDLARRLTEARWPTPLPGADWTLGMDTQYLRSLMDYWRNGFDWRAIEAALNRHPHFEALEDSGEAPHDDGAASSGAPATPSIHFVHLKAARSPSIPIVLTHGWPSTFAELLTLGQLLSSGAPTASGPCFDVVIPSLPGFIFSSPPTAFGTNMFTVADRWAELMSTLGYPRFLAHGGDLGAGVCTALALRHPDRLLGIHLNFIPGSYQPYVPEAAVLTAEERAFFDRRAAWQAAEGAYAHLHSTKPDVASAGLNDSPLGCAAWILDKFRSWSDCGGDVERCFTRDEMLTCISLYWFTGSMPSALRFYWEGRRSPLTFAARDFVAVPVAIAHFAREIPIPPRSYVERGYNVTRWTEFDRGGHFAALERPDALAADIRSFAATL